MKTDLQFSIAVASRFRMLTLTSYDPKDQDEGEWCFVLGSLFVVVCLADVVWCDVLICGVM